MLSPGQEHALKTGLKLDGEEASTQYMSVIRRNVRVKIIDASTGLKEVYDKFPDLRSFIETSLNWLPSRSEAPQVTAKKSKAPKEEQEFKRLPDIEDMDALEKVSPDEVDRERAFRGI